MADKPIYRGNKLNIMGVPRRMGQLTDEHIRDFYDMQKRDGYAEEAIEELVRTERKSREEIEVICGVRKDETMANKSNDEIRRDMIADYKSGMTYGEIAAKYKKVRKSVSHNFYNWRKAGYLDDCAPATKEKAPPAPAKKKLSWYSLIPAIEAFACSTFGPGTVFDSCTASTENKIVRLGVLTPEGKKVQITIEEYSNE